MNDEADPRPGNTRKSESGEREGEPEPEAVIEKRGAPALKKLVPARPYNLSEAALAQRRAAALNSRGPVSVEGKAVSARNSWKHGLHAASHALSIIGKPCLSTCHKYPCSLVEEGTCTPGSGCLDKEFFLDTLQKMQTAIQTKRYDGVNEIFSLTMAKNLHAVNELLDRIASEGTVVATARTDKDGRIIGWDHVLNPAIHAVPKLMGVLGLTFDSLLLTPAAVLRAEQNKKEGEEDNAMTVMARALEMMAETNRNGKK